MNSFMYFIFATIVAFVTQGAAAPIPSAIITHLNVTPIQRDSPFPPHTPAPSAQYASLIATVYHSATPTSTPTALPVFDSQTGNETKGGASAWAQTHPTGLILLFTFMPFAICIMLYPIFRYLALRRAARLAKKTAKSEEKVTVKSPPENLPSPYINNPRLEPLPAHPQMVYVPPKSKHGTIPIFGHFRSPSGNVYGVTDRWVMAEGRTVYGPHPDRSSDSQSLFVYPV